MFTALLLAALAVSTVAAAPPDAHVNARFSGGSEADRSACQRLIDEGPRPTDSERGNASAQLPVCLQLARAALQSAPDAVLLETYRALEALRPWMEGNRTLTDEWTRLERDTAVALDSRGLLGKTYAAVVRAQVVDAEPGGYVGEEANATDRGRTSATVGVALETEHMKIGGAWDFSLTFDAAAQPLFVMVRTEDGRVVPAFMSGVATSTGFRLARATRSTETALVGAIGGGHISSDATTFGSGSLAESVSIAANGMNQWALFMDGSIDFRWYPRDVWLVHLETEPLDPLFHIYGGLRHDQRLHRSGDLENFADPTGRIFFGFDVTPFHVPARRDGARVAIGAGFRFEGALARTQRLPSGYEAYLTASVDLTRAFVRRRS